MTEDDFVFNESTAPAAEMEEVLEKMEKGRGNVPTEFDKTVPSLPPVWEKLFRKMK